MIRQEHQGTGDRCDQEVSDEGVRRERAGGAGAGVVMDEIAADLREGLLALAVGAGQQVTRRGC